MRSGSLALLVAMSVLLGHAGADGAKALEITHSGGLTVSPSDLKLQGFSARRQLLVAGEVDGRPGDLTRQAGFRSETPGVVEV
ncbi:hypothetical protein ACYOEI_25460, partial [Singulisphaera rosea]